MMRRAMPRLCAAVERFTEEYDAVIVGGGPAGLAAAIRLKQLAGAENADNIRIAVVEKGSQIGAHSLSGACIEPGALTELLPTWCDDGCPLTEKVTADSFHYLTAGSAIKSPLLPPALQNHGNYLGSLGALCQWMGEQAEALGVEIYPGFAAAEPLYNEDGTALEGVQLGDNGIQKNGDKSPQYEPGMVFKARQTILAEGCRGSLTKMMEQKFALRKPGNFQTYGLGIKEVWEVPDDKFNPGEIIHTAGWPLTDKGHDNTYGGAWMYHYGDRLMSVGFVTGLDYTNPYTRPYMEMQKWKTHPFIRDRFAGAKPVWYGARTLSEGGLASQPTLAFPGGCLIGDCAGFLNLPKIKGNHAAMKSGMLAAEGVWEQFYAKSPSDKPDYGKTATLYPELYKQSWLFKELNEVRNVRQMFAKNFLLGVAYTGVTSMITKGMEPVTLPHHAPDHTCLKPAKECTPIEYPKPDGKLTFDLLTNHARSGTEHNADQPAHLKLAKPEVATAVNLAKFDGPEGRYCPAGVYEFVDDADGAKKLVINAQNCLHCKACDIKDPTQNINWTCPEGSGGPNYSAQM